MLSLIEEMVLNPDFAGERMFRIEYWDEEAEASGYPREVGRIIFKRDWSKSWETHPDEGPATALPSWVIGKIIEAIEGIGRSHAPPS